MARKPAGKKVETVTTIREEREEGGEELELEGGDPEALPGDEDDADALAELDELGGTGARYEIRRTAPAPFTGYVGTYPRDQFSADRLMSEWGGGNFTIRVRGSNGTLLGSKQIQLAGEPHHKREPNAQGPAAQIAQPSGELAGVLAAIQASSKAAQDANAGQINLLTSLVTSLINKPAPTPPAAPDPLAMIAALKDVLKPDKGDSGADQVKLLLQGVTLGKELSGGGGDNENSMADVALKGFDTLKELAAVTSHAQPARPVARRPALPRAVAPAPGTVPATEAAPAAQPTAPNHPEGGEMTDVQKQIAWIKQQTVTLSRLAHQQKDPDLYAEVFLDNLPPFVTREMIHEQMRKPDAVARLVFLNANVKKYAAWFEEFRKSVVDLLENPDDAEEVSPEDLDVEGGIVLDEENNVADIGGPMPGSEDDGAGS